MQRTCLTLLTCLLLISSAQAELVEKGPLKMDVVTDVAWQFGDELGRRLKANVDNWLLRAPGANPGLLEMFRRRDRHLPYKTPVPWAGEFAGKYLLSTVQACRMSDDQRLRPHTQAFVDLLVAGQAEDGYLGPWRKEERLLGHWDLWGHYHCMLGLLAWHDLTGDQQAMDCAIRAADCIADIYAEGEKRPIDAGTPQINLAVLHVLGDLYRRTENPRYRTLMARIEEDCQKDGDWLRLGAAGVPYHKLPGGGTRWESLHIVQGFVELYRITGDETYKKAVVSLWNSIRAYDRHPSGAFSTHESAFGTIYEPGSVETCCCVAWQALTIDVLKLTGDATVADELELTTWNQVLGAQHPSGSWWTYDTPLDGVRVPSYQHIDFQYRPGTPELNCCSVNAPRGLGMLSEWAVMKQDDALVVNFYGPGSTAVDLGNNKTLTIEQDTVYPLPVGTAYTIALKISADTVQEISIKLRLPSWASSATVSVKGEDRIDIPNTGNYHTITRSWKQGTTVQLSLTAKPTWWHGQDGRYGHAALRMGPLLLAFDAYHNELETAELTGLPAKGLSLSPVDSSDGGVLGRFDSLGLWETHTADGKRIVLTDFASAGAHGTDYVSWLPVADPPPPAVKLITPKKNDTGRLGPILFRWSDSGVNDINCEVEVAQNSDFSSIVATIPAKGASHVVLREELAEGTYFWRVRSRNGSEVVSNRDGPRSFQIKSGASRSFYTVRADGLMVAAELDGDATPSFGECSHEQKLEPAQDRHGNKNGAVRFNGKDSEVRYEVSYFPGDAYTFTAWVSPEGIPVGSIEQVFSSWSAGMDDPLRVSIQGDKLNVRMEAGTGFRTQGIPVENGNWYHVAAVKEGSILTFYANGKAVGTVDVPETLRTHAEQLGIGFNPLFSGGEHFHGRLDNIAFYARALTPGEIVAVFERE